MVAPDTVSLDGGPLFLADNTPWTLSPVQQIRDIGADNVANSVIVRADTEGKSPEKKPHSNKTNIAGKDESE